PTLRDRAPRSMCRARAARIGPRPLARPWAGHRRDRPPRPHGHGRHPLVGGPVHSATDVHPRCTATRHQMTRSTPARSPRYLVLVLGLGLAAALTIPPAPAATAAVDGVSTATVHVDATQPGRVIPLDFLGLSFEADLLNQPSTDPEAGNIDELLMNLGTGTMRFSANQ